MSTLYRVADRVRRVWWRAWGPITLGVRGLVVDDGGRVLLVRHSYGADTWHLPGGGVKRREKLTDAVRRELNEEAGIDGGDLRLFGCYSNMREGKSDHIAVFLVTGWTRHETASVEIAEQRLFSPNELPDNVSPGSRRRIEEWAGRGPSVFDW